MTFSKTPISAQYAFAIGFDFESSGDELGRQPTETATLEAVSTAIRSAGLPEVSSDRWDEFGQGRIFWGTKAECDAVQQVLSQFTLFLQEERNLEAGFYATPESTYYVDEAGNLYAVLNPFGAEGDSALEATSSIPLDAYRLKTVDPHVQHSVARALSSLIAQDVSSLPPSEPSTASSIIETEASSPQDSEVKLAALEAQIVSLTSALEALQTTAHASESELSASRAQIISLTSNIERLQAAAAAHTALASKAQALEAQIDQQTTHIYELERQVTMFEDQIAALESIAATKIDPQLYANLQTQLTQQTQHIQQLEERLAQAEGQVQQQQRQDESLIDPQAYAQLQQQLSAQTTQSQELQQRIWRLEQQLQDAIAVAAQKVDPAKHQALEQSVADKTAQAEDLRRAMLQLQRDLTEWQTVAESKVEWAQYEAIQQELRQLQVKQKKGWFSRLFGWLFG